MCVESDTTGQPAARAHVLALAEDAEKLWVSTRDPKYFEVIYGLCHRVHNSLQFGNAEYDCLRELASSALTKDVGDDPYQNWIAFGSRSKIVKLLLGERVAPYITTAPLPVRIYARSNNTRLIALFMRSVMSRIRPGFRYLPVSKNVAVPNGAGQAGMDPKAIMDPKARADYEQAIATNAANNAINTEQRSLSLFLSDEVPSIELCLEAQYSAEPIAYRELTEYMVLGCFSEDARQRVLAAVIKSCGVQPPVGLAPPSKSKSQ
jgi:hypothetical protein